MKHLIIMRHGDARRDDVTLTDAQRPLSPLGRRQTQAAAAEFSAPGKPVDAVLSSPAKRALDTADIWLETLNIPEDRLQMNENIYEAERIDLLRIVEQLDDAVSTVILVGHNPGVSGLLHHLVGRGVETMATSSCAVIAINVDRWRDVALRHAQLVHYYTPPADAGAGSLWKQFDFWRKQRIQKVELFAVFLLGLVVIVGIVIAIFAMRPGSEAQQSERSVNIIESE